MVALCKKIADDTKFQLFILGLIIFNAILLGVETSEDLTTQHADMINFVEAVILVLFVLEILIRITAYYPDVSSYFRDGWNVFDFTVVAICVIPEVGPLGSVVRLARVLRIVRVIKFSKELRLIVDTLLRSIPSMGHVVLMLGLLLYVYGIIGHQLFKDIDPKRWDSLGISMWSMFQTLTFENWVGLQDPLLEKHWWVWIYFASFILLAVFVGMNLFIAVIMNNLGEIKAEQQTEEHSHDTFQQLIDHVEKVKTHLAEMESALQSMKQAKDAAGSK